MIKRLLGLIIVSLLVQIGWAAAQSDDPIVVEVDDFSETVCYANCPEYGYSGDMPQDFITHTYTRVTVQARTDSIMIESVEINRGNCQFLSSQLPANLKFGEHVSLMVQKSDTIFAKGCQILEVAVKTDQGEFVYTD